MNDDQAVFAVLEIEHLRQRAAQAEVLQSEVLALRRERDDLLAALSQAASTRNSASSSQPVPRLKGRSPEVRSLRKRLSVLRKQLRRERRRNADLRAQLQAVRESRSYRICRRLSAVVRGSVRNGTSNSPEPPRPPAQRRPKQVSKKSLATQAKAPGDKPQRTLPTADGPRASARPEAGGSKIAAPNPQVKSSILLDGRGATRDDLAGAVAHVAGLAGRVVVVLDTPEFDIPREQGLPIEYIPDLSWLADRVGGTSAAALVESRWDEIVATHCPTEIYTPRNSSKHETVPTMTWFAEEGLA